jgi:thioredoxin-related protein
MRYLCLTFLTTLLLTTSTWQTDFEKAKQSAQTEKKLILLNFSGSDWCGPCIRMHKEIFESSVFIEYADKNLVLVNADFPRMKKNQLSKEQQQKNDHLADLYDQQGEFPLTVLLTADGKVLKTWVGFPSVSPDEFTNDVKAIVNANN